MRKPYKRQQPKTTSLAPVENTPTTSGGSLINSPQGEIQPAGNLPLDQQLDQYATSKNLELVELHVTEKRKVSRSLLDSPALPEPDPPGRIKRGLLFVRNVLGYAMFMAIVYFSLSGLDSDNPWTMAAGMNMAVMLSCFGPLVVGAILFEALGLGMTAKQKSSGRENVSVTVRRSYKKKR